LQFHGTLSQGFIYASGNNYLTMDSNSRSARWSEGVVNLGMAITDNFLRRSASALLHHGRDRERERPNRLGVCRLPPQRGLGFRGGN
jgi:hypothetical protein